MCAFLRHHKYCAKMCYFKFLQASTKRHCKIAILQGATKRQKKAWPDVSVFCHLDGLLLTIVSVRPHVGLCWLLGGRLAVVAKQLEYTFWRNGSADQI